jgi:hypothetical protein
VTAKPGTKGANIYDKKLIAKRARAGEIKRLEGMKGEKKEEKKT